MSLLKRVNPSEYEEKVVNMTTGEEHEMAKALLSCARKGDIEILFDTIHQQYVFRNKPMEGIV